MYEGSFYFSVFNQIYDPNHALSDCLQLYKSDIAAHGWDTFGRQDGLLQFLYTSFIYYTFITYSFIYTIFTNVI